MSRTERTDVTGPGTPGFDGFSERNATEYERRQLDGSSLTTPVGEQWENASTDPARGRASREGQAAQGSARGGNATSIDRGYRES